MTASPECPTLNATACVACGTTPTATIPGEGWTPLCAACVQRVGTKLTIGERAVCQVGSIEGRVLRFDERTWGSSSLAELAHDDGLSAWYPLAELAPAT
jgi:hypothetical protein